MAMAYTKEQSDAIKEDFIKMFDKMGATVYLTCKKIGITTGTYHLWRQNDVEFKRATDEVRETIKDKMEYSLVHDALTKGGTDRIFYMKTQMKDRGYIERVENTGKDGESLAHSFKMTETDTDLMARMKDQMKREIIEEYEAAKLLTQTLKVEHEEI